MAGPIDVVCTDGTISAPHTGSIDVTFFTNAAVIIHLQLSHVGQDSGNQFAGTSSLFDISFIITVYV